MKRDLKLTLGITADERAYIECLQRDLAERGTRASLSGIAVAIIRQFRQQNSVLAAAQPQGRR